MNIEFKCENCGQPMSIDEEHVGKQADCPKCGVELTIPGPATEVESSTTGRKKCPKCGKIYPESVVVCPDCNILLKGRRLSTADAQKKEFSWKPVVVIVIIFIVLTGGYLFLSKATRATKTAEEAVKMVKKEDKLKKETPAVGKVAKKVKPELSKPKPEKRKPKPDPALTARLFEAMRVQDVGAVKKLVAKGADVNAKNKNGFPALYGAHHFNAWKKTDEEIAEGKRKAKEMVLILIENGADVEATTDPDWKILNWAGREGYTDVIEVLLEKGVNIDARDHQGYTALHFTVKWGNVDAGKLLIDRGANVNVQDNKSQTPLQLAEEYAKTYGKEEMKKKSTVLAKYMREHGRKGAVVKLDKAGYKSLVSAVAGNRIDAVKYLIKKGVDLNETHQFCTPLYTAANNNYKDIAKLLIESGADVNARGKNGETPLVGAVQAGRYASDIVKNPA